MNTKDKAKEVFKEIESLRIMYKEIPPNEFIFIEPIEKAFKVQAQEIFAEIEQCFSRETHSTLDISKYNKLKIAFLEGESKQ